MLELREIEITEAAKKHGNLSLSICGKNFFPDDIFGASSKKLGQGKPVYLKIEGIPEVIETDIPTAKDTNKPRWIFRERSWVKKFIAINDLMPGNIVIIKRIDERKYELVANKNHQNKRKTVNRNPEKRNKTSKAKKRKIIDINYDKTCDCKGNKINCLTAKEWLKCQLGVWTFNYTKRDIRNKKVHPATFPISLASKVIELFSHRGELVLDPFVGSGTTLVAAQDLGRNAVGFDLKKEYVDLSNTRLKKNEQLFSTCKQTAIYSDAKHIPDYIKENSVKCIFTSPPYANLLNRKRKNKSRRNRDNGQYDKIEQYSQDVRDLETMELEKYTKEMGDIFESLLNLLRPKAHCVINVPDMWWENKRITIHVSLIEELRKRGYELRNIIIWDRTNLVNQIGIFGWPSNYITMGVTFEYLLDFWRPE